MTKGDKSPDRAVGSETSFLSPKVVKKTFFVFFLFFSFGGDFANIRVWHIKISNHKRR